MCLSTLPSMVTWPPTWLICGKWQSTISTTSMSVSGCGQSCDTFLPWHPLSFAVIYVELLSQRHYLDVLTRKTLTAWKQSIERALRYFGVPLLSLSSDKGKVSICNSIHTTAAASGHLFKGVSLRDFSFRENQPCVKYGFAKHLLSCEKLLSSLTLEFCNINEEHLRRWNSSRNGRAIDIARYAF